MSNKHAKDWNKFEGQNEITRKETIVDITFEYRNFLKWYFMNVRPLMYNF
jgi:hypothetical protein